MRTAESGRSRKRKRILATPVIFPRLIFWNKFQPLSRKDPFSCSALKMMFSTTIFASMLGSAIIAEGHKMMMMSAKGKGKGKGKSTVFDKYDLVVISGDCSALTFPEVRKPGETYHYQCDLLDMYGYKIGMASGNCYQITEVSADASFGDDFGTVCTNTDQFYHHGHVYGSIVSTGYMTIYKDKYGSYESYAVTGGTGYYKGVDGQYDFHISDDGTVYHFYYLS